MLHVSQISKEHVEKPSDVLNIGDKIRVKVIDINYEDRRISLSKKDLEEKGSVEEVKVEEVKDENNSEEDVTIEDIINNK